MNPWSTHALSSHARSTSTKYCWSLLYVILFICIYNTYIHVSYMKIFYNVVWVMCRCVRVCVGDRRDSHRVTLTPLCFISAFEITNNRRGKYCFYKHTYIWYMRTCCCCCMDCALLCWFGVRSPAAIHKRGGTLVCVDIPKFKIQSTQMILM